MDSIVNLKSEFLPVPVSQVMKPLLLSIHTKQGESECMLVKGVSDMGRRSGQEAKQKNARQQKQSELLCS